MSTQFRIRPAHPPDFQSMLPLDLAANLTHPFYTIPWITTVTPSSFCSEFILDRYRHLYHSQNPECGFLVATTRTISDGVEEIVVGYLIYQKPPAEGNSGEIKIEEWNPKFPEGTNLRFLEKVMGEVRSAKRTLELDLSGCWELEGFAVHPNHQRKGIGSLLVKKFLEVVDANHAPCYVHSSRTGKTLYEKFGFKVLGVVSVDLKEFGDYEPYVTWDMKRDAV